MANPFAFSFASTFAAGTGGSSEAQSQVPSFQFDFSALGGAVAASNAVPGSFVPTANPFGEPKRVHHLGELSERQRLLLTINVLKQACEEQQKKLQAAETSAPAAAKSVAAPAAGVSEEKKQEEFILKKQVLPEPLRQAAAVASPEDLSIITGATFRKVEPPSAFGPNNSEPSSAGSSDEDTDEDDDEENDDDDGSDADIALTQKQRREIEKDDPKAEPEKPKHEPNKERVAELEAQITDLEAQAAALPGKKNYPKRKKINDRIAILKEELDAELNGPEDPAMSEIARQLQETVQRISDELNAKQDQLESLKGAKYKKQRQELEKQIEALTEELIDALQAAGMDDEGDEEGDEEDEDEEDEPPARSKGAAGRRRSDGPSGKPQKGAAAAGGGGAKSQPKLEVVGHSVAPANKNAEAANKNEVPPPPPSKPVTKRSIPGAHGKARRKSEATEEEIDSDEADEETDEEGDSDEDSDETREDSDSDDGLESWQKFPFEQNLFILMRYYQFLGRVGTNTDAVVYKAIDLQTGDWVTVKIKDFLPRDPFKTPKEVKLLTALQGHPGVPTLSAWYALPATKCHASVTSYVPNQEIEDSIFGEPVRAQKYLKDVIEILMFCHSRNVLYRDLKPSNILWSNEANRAVLIDYDVSTFYDPVRKHRREVGTDGYMAPEVVSISRAFKAREKAEKEAYEANKAKLRSDKLSPEERTAVEEAIQKYREDRANKHKVVPPEGGYGLEADVYSLGVVFGSITFLTREEDITDDDMLEHKGAGFLRRINELRKDQPDRLTSAHDLLARMLEEDPSKRITLKECLEHPYFSEPRTNKDIIPDTISMSKMEASQNGDSDEGEEDEDEEDEEEEDEEDEEEDEEIAKARRRAKFVQGEVIEEVDDNDLD